MSINDFTAKLATTGLPWYVARIISWGLGVNALVTGWDYLHTPPDVTRSLTMVERLATIHTWGIWYLVAGGILLIGLMLRRHAIVWLGHFLLAILYTAFTTATFQAVWNIVHTNPHGPSIWRAVTMSAVITTLHWVLCYVRGPVPRRGDEQ